MSLPTRPTTGWAARFTRNGEAATRTHHSLLNFTGAFCVDLWVYPFADQVVGYPAFFCKGNVNSAWQAQIDSDSGTKFNFRVKSGGVSYDAKDPTNIPRSTWTRYTCIYTGAAVQLQKNRVQVATTALAGAVDTNANPLRFGDGESAGSNSIRGLIWNVAIFDHAPTSDELDAGNDAPWVGDESGLVANWFHGPSTGEDKTSNGLDLVMASFDQWSRIRETPF
jgi:hypothetical protein